MSSGSPSAYLLWAILSSIFLVFLCLHLWAYDRFACLQWHSGRQPGAFKRVMTYSYLATLPLLVVFSVAMTIIKFKEGYVYSPTTGVFPTPLQSWKPHHKSWLLPLYFVLSIAWSLEIVTHLEELAFWLFLLHQGPQKRHWFRSWEFRTWYLGSIVAIIGMPLTTLLTRREIERVQAYIFLSGSTAGVLTTLMFLHVLSQFPGFIRFVKSGGAEPDVVVRLATFYQLNRIRVLFRFLFSVPLLIIAIDGLKGPYPIIGHPFALDFLLMMGGLGCFISSAITLLVFFPRSITRESGYSAKIISPQNSTTQPSLTSPLPNYSGRQQHLPHTRKRFYPDSNYHSHAQDGDDVGATAGLPDEGVYGTQSHPAQPRPSSDVSTGYESDSDSISVTTPTSPIPMQDLFTRPYANDRAESGSGSTEYNNSSTSRTMVSQGRSVDTRWERSDNETEAPRELLPASPHPRVQRQEQMNLPNSSPQEIEGRTRRRYSDGFFVANRRRQSLLSSASPPVEQVAGRSGFVSEDSHDQSQQSSTNGHGTEMRGKARVRDIERGVLPSMSTVSHLHPYVLNFTSPIDLLDYDLSDETPHAFPPMPARV